MGARRRCGAYARDLLVDVNGDSALSALLDDGSASNGDDEDVDAVVEAGANTEGLKGQNM